MQVHILQVHIEQVQELYSGVSTGPKIPVFLGHDFHHCKNKATHMCKGTRVCTGAAAEQLWAASAPPAAAQAGADWLSGPDPLRGVPLEVLLEGALRRPLRLQVCITCCVLQGRDARPWAASLGCSS